MIYWNNLRWKSCWNISRMRWDLASTFLKGLVTAYHIEMLMQTNKTESGQDGNGVFFLVDWSSLWAHLILKNFVWVWRWRIYLCLDDVYGSPFVVQLVGLHWAIVVVGTDVSEVIRQWCKSLGDTIAGYRNLGWSYSLYTAMMIDLIAWSWTSKIGEDLINLFLHAATWA